MNDSIDFSEVPHLQEILNYLPMNPDDGEDVNNYVQNIANLITINYKYEQYQFAYLGIHLLYMTYIYSTTWKISQIESERYKDAIVFARSYNGREKDLKIDEATSIFDYSLIPEKDIARIFKLIDLDKSQISVVGDFVDIRNEMAHASGKFEILTEVGFEVKVNSILTSMKLIHKSMNTSIRKWYKRLLLSYCKGEYEDYKNPADIIEEQIVQSFKISINELIICNDMSLRELITEHRNHQGKLKKFKQVMTEYCKNMGYTP